MNERMGRLAPESVIPGETEEAARARLESAGFAVSLAHDGRPLAKPGKSGRWPLPGCGSATADSWRELAAYVVGGAVSPAVDVLAVIDARIAVLGKPENEAANSPRRQTRNELTEARAAVARIMAAAQGILADVDAPGHTVRNVRGESVAALRAALAAVGGAR